MAAELVRPTHKEFKRKGGVNTRCKPEGPLLNLKVIDLVATQWRRLQGRALIWEAAVGERRGEGGLWGVCACIPGLGEEFDEWEGEGRRGVAFEGVVYSMRYSAEACIYNIRA